MEEVIVQNQKSELSSLSIRDLFFKYVRFLPIFVLSVAIALFGAYIYLRYATPIYESTGALIIEDDKPQSSSNDKFDQILNSGGSKNIQNEIEVLKSRPLMERVVKALNLNFSYYAKGKIKELNLYKSSPFYIEAFKLTDSSNSFDISLNFANNNTFQVNGEKTPFTFGQVFTNQYGVFRLVKKNSATVGAEYRINWTPTYALASGFANSIVAVPKSQGTQILLLSLRTTNASLTADIINQLIIEYTEYTLEKKNTTNQQSKAFIEERVKVVAREVDSINDKRIAYMRANNISDLQGQSVELSTRLSESDKEVNNQRILLEQSNLIDNYLRTNKNEPVATPLGIPDPTLASMITAYNAAQIDYQNSLKGKVPAGNVVMQQKAEQIEKLRTKILESNKNVRSGIGATIQSFQQQKNTAESKLRTMPAQMQGLEDINRQLASKLTVYNFLMEKQEETDLAIAANIPNSKMLDQATVTNIPVSPNRKTVQLFAILIGLILPALVIFALEILDDKVSTRHDIEKITSATIIGEVGHSYASDALVATHNNRSVVAEQFRIIRSNLQYVLHNSSKPVILVTSSFSGEGKSFVSTNVGAVMALAGKKTIILEFDIRKPKILSELNISKKPGLTNYLLGKVPVNELPVLVPGYENLYVLASGPVPPNPSELLLDRKLDDLFDHLKQNFDTIIIDTAPVGMVSDAMTLSKFANATLYIVRQGKTFKKQIGMIDELYQSKKLPQLSLVLNDVKIRTGYGYYGYGRYGYGYGYGSGYFQEEEPPTLFNRWFGWMSFGVNGKKKRKKTTV